MIKCCIFDLDGTLIDSLADLSIGMNYALEKNKYPVHVKELYRNFVGDGVKMLVKRALPDDASQDIQKKVLADYSEYYSEHYLDFTRPYTGINEMLADLKTMGIICCVLSNKPDAFTQRLINELFRNTFDLVIGQSDTFPNKPHPAALKHILEKLNVKEEESLFIGDSNTDILTGKNAGLSTVGVTWGFRGATELEQAGSDFIIDSPEQLVEMIKKSF